MNAMHHLINTAIILLFTTFSATAQNKKQPRPAVSPETLALYVPGEFKGVKYRLMKPIGFDPKKTYPLILSLHGAGGRGSNNIKNLRNWNEWLADKDLRRRHPCFVLAPQSPTSWFDPFSEHSILPEPGSVVIEDLPEGMRKFARRSLDLAAEVAENPDDPRLKEGVLGRVLEFIDTELVVQYKIDADRVYCIGHSMGGAGTFTAVYQHPDRFAAAIPSAGIFFPWLDARRLKDVPLWIFHGKDDKVVDYIGSRSPFERLQKLGANTKLTTIAGVGHAATVSFNYTGDDPEKGYVTEHASGRTDQTDQVWDWLFRQKRSRQVGDAALNKTLEEINARFKHVELEFLEWPDELHEKLGKMKKLAFVARPVEKFEGKLPLLISLHGGGQRWWNMSLQEQLAISAPGGKIEKLRGFKKLRGYDLAELAGKGIILLEPNTAGLWDADSLDTMLDYLLAKYPRIDKDRVYVMGYSMGGRGTWAWIKESADRFAAAAPCGAGGGDTFDVKKLAKLPIWAMAGGADGDRTTGVRKMVERLRAAGNVNVKHTELEGADHRAGGLAVFSSVELVEWMLGFSKGK